MVREVKREEQVFYVCEECGFTYKDQEWAEKCEDFCAKHRMCSLEITSHAVQID